MELTELSRQVRLVCESALPLAELLASADEFAEGSSSSATVSTQLDQELQSVYDDVVDHSAAHIQIFLALLFHLRLLLSPESIVSSWFDFVLRPALRLPKLSTIAVQQARELVLLALSSDDEACQKKVLDFRRRVLDLYLYDALNEGSGDDVLIWAELNSVEREKKLFWKSNLEETLIKFGELKPLDLMNEIDHHFVDPASRLQLVIFMNIYVSSTNFASSSAAAILAEHPLMDNLIMSLLIDTSTTVCTIGLNVLTKLLPIYAAHAPSALLGMIHRLFAVFARILCWKKRLVISADHPDPMENEEWEDDEDADSSSSLQAREALNWQLLGPIFTQTSPAPNCRTYFSFLYFLLPCSLFQFLREPVSYFNDSLFPSPYQKDWDSVLDETKIRTLSEYLCRRHIFHPMMLWQDAKGERDGQCFWMKWDVARIATEATILDIRNMSLALRERLREDVHKTTLDDASPEKYEPPKVSLQSMAETTALLKSGINIDTIRTTTSHWPIPVSREASDTENASEPHSSSDADAPVPSFVKQAISDLQRQVLLLRNELNFELWLARENIKHIGRLYHDRTLTQNAEVERQGLYNKLRNYRTQVVRLESELRENKEQAVSAKNQYVDWNTELQKKLRELREEKKSWLAEAAKLRSDSAEAAGLFAAQGRLLSDATTEVFQLQTQRKETQHKIDRLHDYEKQIDQHMKMQMLWDQDFARFNERGQELEFVKSRNKQLEIRLQSLEENQQGLERDNE
ncbi:hypothetical protein V5O48_001774 [Marasmius crinis-equi]|uniref:Hamartin n=1 Tax=Marasmius crinis-equi TaxID=585013 RepID=A0ABR3FY55_9AGAR